MYGNMDTNCLGVIIVKEQSVLIKYKKIWDINDVSINLLE